MEDRYAVEVCSSEPKVEVLPNPCHKPPEPQKPLEKPPVKQ